MEHRIIDQQLDLLRDKILLLGGMTEAALQRAMRSLTERDSDLARKVLEIDRLSIDIIGSQQPASHDLRFVISVAKITPILERIADHASNIAEAALILNNEPVVSNYIDMSMMAEIAADMLRTALDAFTTEDAAVSRQVIKRDKEIDRAYNRVFGELIQGMIGNPSSVTAAAQLLFVAKHLERIGDYVKDICELTVYLREAAFIKHSQSIHFSEQPSVN
jgi:phosphate transport system protein